MSLTTQNLSEFNERLNSAHPLDILHWANSQFTTPSSLFMTSSFGAESLCLIHLAHTVRPGIPILFINTGYLFPETLSFMELMRRRFNLNILEYHSKQDPFVYLSVRGETDPRQRKDVASCCAANKNEVMDRAMSEQVTAYPASESRPFPGWLRGVRASQSEERKQMQVIQFSQRYHCWAISPLLHWSDAQVHAYMSEHQLPYHPLYAEGYTSIGCSPETCTRPTQPGQDPRSGRWANSSKTECGIHLPN